ncbi:nicotinamidase [Candidatus Falkowbacteria bacterium RIFOXYD2_FULL_34_120]|uniref:nicotinamidase n=1 Tax=Candidatus Falkowbacteria bacterium RIFOXYD2_FULL_34_120 TaxID=1798007 RepID=A0A1F5TRJ5_9BACT|nr:MAG: nicotinamidase [Candidatus Falkowbacteria bacterium RIFOXYC2_FULL_34_220]OGF39433.1 MAG: nicotinamidase [Candidatus Falkowbacteria bacterium RIFOXYD12_FULL_34_57]OGF41585.1 MAG: nicotinamidase [Candidatus Falkowbacteria bacterium RIFOXYD2_FULL_34_120]
MTLYVKKEKTASFDVDPQNCFTDVCPDELPVPGGTDIVDELNTQAKKAKIRIVSKEAHPPNAKWIADDDNPQFSAIDGENMDIRWNAHGIVGTKGFKLIKGLPAESEYNFIAYKGIEPDMHPYGACYHDFAEKMSTGAIEVLKENNIETLILGGLATDYCVKMTVLQLLKAGFKVIVNLAACRGIDEKTVKTAIKEMEKKGATFVKNSQEIKNIY